jgi:hypothetical protein
MLCFVYCVLVNIISREVLMPLFIVYILIESVGLKKCFVFGIYAQINKFKNINIYFYKF